MGTLSTDKTAANGAAVEDLQGWSTRQQTNDVGKRLNFYSS